MNNYKLSNIPLKTLKWFLEHNGLKCTKHTGGHEKWTRKDLPRPIIVQSHITPVPEFILKQILKHLGFSKREFCEYIEKNY
ncbi:MAG: type II toxin-antitoxin system HicA family toxin [Crocinitomix sp.]|nr:type II toxin-antitoxin system HicA family toxin [Crocinitomix sp.]